MSNIISIGSSEIRQIDGLYSLNDLHKASGQAAKHRPSYFLSNDQTKALIAEIDHCRNSGSALKVINGGQDRGTYASKELVIAYAAWISPAFHLQVIRVFLNSQKAPAVSTLPAVRSLTKEEQTAINMRAHVLAQEKYREIRGELMSEYLAGRVDQLDKWKPEPASKKIPELPFRPVSMSAHEQEVIESVFRSRRYLMYFDHDGKPVVYGLDNEQFVTSSKKLARSIRDGGELFNSLEISEILQACAERLAHDLQKGRS